VGGPGRRVEGGGGRGIPKDIEMKPFHTLTREVDDESGNLQEGRHKKMRR